MTIRYAPYTLRARDALSSRSAATEREGVLLQVETPAGVGYADLHPWPELGDEPLSNQLQALREGRPTRLGQQSLSFACIDGKARAAGRSLWAGADVPASHFLITDLEQTGPDRIAALENDGFRVVKIKVGRNPQREAERLHRLAEDGSQEMIFRLDMNEALDLETCRGFLRALPAHLRSRIEFVEDPIPFAEQAWAGLSKETHIHFALDRAGLDEKHIEAGARANAFSHLVLKPAVQDVMSAVATLDRSGSVEARLVVTSYMDHPLGQAAAAYQAAQLRAVHGRRVVECGLLSHTVYEVNEFSECLRVQGPSWIVPEGTGFGFDEPLRRQTWRAL